MTVEEVGPELVEHIVTTLQGHLPARRKYKSRRERERAHSLKTRKQNLFISQPCQTCRTITSPPPKRLRLFAPLLELGQLLWLLLPHRMWLNVTLWVWVGLCSDLAASALTLLEDKRLLENEWAHGERGLAILAEAPTWVRPADAVWVIPAQSSPNCQPTELWANK